MSILDDFKEAIGLVDSLKETIFFKENGDIYRLEALKKLNEEYPNNAYIQKELNNVIKGIKGEDEIAYQLKKSSIGMCVLRDINVECEDLTAQIDYIIVTPVYTYFVECKNWDGSFTVTDKGDFIIEKIINGRKIKQGMESPYRQVEAQREVMRKIWEKKTSKIQKLAETKDFNYYRKVLVVFANKKSILNTSKAPNDIKYRVVKADNLIRQIEYDLNHIKENDYWKTRDEMIKTAQSYLSVATMDKTDYYEYYKDRFCNSNSITDEEDLRNRLIYFRKNRARELNIPAYYVFTNEELDKIIEIKPKTLEELKNANILVPIKIKTHGEEIIKEINKE